MKKLILFSILAAPAVMLANVSTPPQNVSFVKNVFVTYLSPNGEWIANSAGDASVYNIPENKVYSYEDSEAGRGNAIANNGMMAGDVGFVPVVFYLDKVNYPSKFIQSYDYGTFNGINADGTRAVGFVGNPLSKDEIMMEFPSYVDIDANGNVGEIKILPHPELDLFGSPVQRVIALAVSDDGKTIVGEITDFRGMYEYPIVFTEDNQGNWEYSLPTEDLFNPTGIVLPANPDVSEPTFPEPEDFMSGIRYQEYLTAMERWENGYEDEQPNPLDYMNDVQKESYRTAAEIYNTWFYDNEEANRLYRIIYLDVLKTSPNFGFNHAKVSPDGTMISSSASLLDDSYEEVSYLYTMNVDGSNLRKYPSPQGVTFPIQILPDNAVIASQPKGSFPNTFIFPPSGKGAIFLLDFLKTDYPQVASWIQENFGFGTGQVFFSYDMSVLAGGIEPDLMSEYDEDTADYWYSTYIVNNLILSDVKEIKTDNINDGIYRVYNLQGVKMLETKDRDAISSLNKGIYIINGKKVVIK